MNRNKTAELNKRLCQVIPGGVNSPVRAGTAVNHMPLIVDKGFKDLIYDIDGNSYIDYCCSWGALIHGHAHPDIVSAAQKKIALGSSFGITTSVEEKLARKIVDHIQSVEKIRFVSSGTEATMSVVRLARGYTKKDKIVKFIGHYHGHADFFLVQAGSGVTGLSHTSSSEGIPADSIRHTICLPFNDVGAWKNFLKTNNHDQNIAAVIIEPIAGNMGVVPATKEFIQILREDTEKEGILLIFDEVITGFRVGLKGAQHLYQVKPDLTSFGKVIGGGFPAAAFGGRSEIMDYLAPLGPVYQAGTLSGNPVAMEAGLQALMMLEDGNIYSELERKTALLADPIQKYLRENQVNACLQRVGSMFTLFFGRRSILNKEDTNTLDLETYTRFFKYMLSQGIYIPPSQFEAWFVSSAHEDVHLIKTRDAILHFFQQ